MRRMLRAGWPRRVILPLAAVLILFSGGPAHSKSAPKKVTAVRWLTAPPVDTLRPRDTTRGLGTSVLGAACLRIRRIKQDSGYTTVYCSLLDPRGEPVSEIGPGDLKCSLNERPQALLGIDLMADRADEHIVTVLALGFRETVESAPLLVSALSGSFLPELEEEKSDLCALLTFSGKVSVPRLFTSDPLLLKQSLSHIHFTGEGLLVNAAVDAARTLIRQHDTSGYGVVVLAGDAGLAESEAYPAAPLAASPGGIPVFGLQVASGTEHPDALELICASSGGELFAATPDSLAVHTAVGRIIRILQRQLIIRIPAGLSGQLKLQYSKAGWAGPLADSATLVALWPAPVDASDTSPRSRLVLISLAVGLVLLVAILILHAKSQVK